MSRALVVKRGSDEMGQKVKEGSGGEAREGNGDNKEKSSR